MFCRLLNGCCTQGFSDSILLMNDHLTKVAPQKTLLQPDDPWMTTKSDVKSYILELLDNITLSRSQCIATSIINYGPYIHNMFALENFAYALHRQLSTFITSKPAPSLAHNLLISRNNTLLLDRQ